MKISDILAHCSSISDFVSVYQDCRNIKDEAASALRAASSDLEIAEKALCDAMIESEVPMIGFKDHRYSLVQKTEYRKDPSISEEQFFDALISNGFGSLIVPKVDSRTFNSQMKMREADGYEIPDDLASCMSTFTHSTISVRKS